jgi:hypothetical protein
MESTFWFNGEDGDSFTDATLHTDKQCANDAGDGHARPLARSSASEDHDIHDCQGGVQTEETTFDESDVEALIDDGVCPWCEEYEGDYLGQHASSAHPEKWTEYRER